MEVEPAITETVHFQKFISMSMIWEPLSSFILLGNDFDDTFIQNINIWLTFENRPREQTQKKVHELTQ